MREECIPELFISQFENCCPSSPTIFPTYNFVPRFYNLEAVIVKIAVSWDVTPCSLQNIADVSEEPAATTLLPLSFI
jgi:hypothetical protein